MVSAPVTYQPLREVPDCLRGSVAGPTAGGGKKAGSDEYDIGFDESVIDPRIASHIFSHSLTNDELKELYNAQGRMPPLTMTKVGEARAQVAARVAFLDDQLNKRVQGISNRLCKTTTPVTGMRERWLHMIAAWFEENIQLGVIADIYPTCLFYIGYTCIVQYYAWLHNWEIMWSATKQDSIYYPAVVLAFLLCFRASGCMDRYNAGLKNAFEMEKALREVAFEVMTKLSVDEDHEDETECQRRHMCSKGMKKKYFKHEYRRISQLLFACAARDLNDSALEDADLSDENAQRFQCLATQVEYAAIRVTHSAFGHAFRVYLVATWLQKVVRSIAEEGLFDDDEVFKVVSEKMQQFKEAWLNARQIAYSSMPSSVTHILWLLTTVMNLFMPWELVSVCRWGTWFPSLLLTISFFGILQIANAMENPFGFDADDIPIWEVAEHLDEEVCLIMHYALLDEVGSENLYRCLMGHDMIFIGAAGSEITEKVAQWEQDNEDNEPFQSKEVSRENSWAQEAFERASSTGSSARETNVRGAQAQ